MVMNIYGGGSSKVWLLYPVVLQQTLNFYYDTIWPLEALWNPSHRSYTLSIN